MKQFRVWLFFALVALAVVAVRLSPDIQTRLQTLVSGYGLLACIMVMVLLTAIYRTLQGRSSKHESESDHTPWWY
jgi:hypothetical protein